MVSWQQTIKSRLENIPIYRTRIARIEKNERMFCTYKDISYLNFVSNDYLGLSTDQQVIQTLQNSANTYGVGSTGAASLSGYSNEAELLSKELANWLGYDRCLLFNSGYQLNLGIYSALSHGNKPIKIWLDKRSHASHIDGILLSKTNFETFTPANIFNIFEKIIANTSTHHIILSEGIFSMDGSCEYLPELIKFRQNNPDNVMLVIDDAHGIGTIDELGHGSLKDKTVDLLIGTLGKSFGVHGGFICGNHTIINYLQQSVRSQIFSTFLPPALFAASRMSLKIIMSQQGMALRQKLYNNIMNWKSLAQKSGLSIYNQKTNLSPIQLLTFNNIKQLDLIHHTLIRNNILTGKMMYPTVPKNQPRLRISVTAHHQAEDLEILIKIISNTIRNNLYG